MTVFSFSTNFEINVVLLSFNHSVNSGLIVPQSCVNSLLYSLPRLNILLQIHYLLLKTNCEIYLFMLLLIDYYLIYLYVTDNMSYNYSSFPYKCMILLRTVSPKLIPFEQKTFSTLRPNEFRFLLYEEVQHNF